MSLFLSELLGTALLILLGNGVVANVCLHKTKANNSGWLVIAIGWALAVTLPVYIFGPITGAHLNPAVTVANAFIGTLDWNLVPSYILAQFLGAMLGALLVFIHYLPHWKETPDPTTQLGCFATMPALSHPLGNFISEFIGTFILVFSLLSVSNTPIEEGLAPLVVGLVILAIGLTLGGTTGYAINPARDLGPRIIYTLLPFSNKVTHHWRYAWIPIVAPFLGGIIGATTYISLF